VEVETESGQLIPISVLIVPSISAPIQNLVSTCVYNMPHLRKKLAHPVSSEKKFTISLLIGTDHYWSFVEDDIIRGDSHTAQRSKLGYFLSGPLPTMETEVTSSALLQISSVITNEPKEADLEHFWSIEAIGTETSTTSPDINFLHLYQQFSISQNSEGVYVAKFPWRQNKPYLFTTCKRKTCALIGKLKKTPELLKVYQQIVTEQEQRGFIEQVQDGDMKCTICPTTQ